MKEKIEILKTEILSDNWYTLNKLTYSKTLEDGTSTTQSREVYDRGNGATVILYNKFKNTVILVKQFRLPSYVNGNLDGMLIEACAGLLELDSPETCIKRETQEETGYQIENVEKIFEAYMSPGSVTELLYFFIASYSNEMKKHKGGGLKEEHEDIEIVELPFKQAVEMVKSGEIKDGKTIMLIQYILINRILVVD